MGLARRSCWARRGQCGRLRRPHPFLRRRQVRPLHAALYVLALDALSTGQGEEQVRKSYGREGGRGRVRLLSMLEGVAVKDRATKTPSDSDRLAASTLGAPTAETLRHHMPRGAIDHHVNCVTERRTLQASLQGTPAWKHSQYFFRHPLFLQWQPLLCRPTEDPPSPS